LNDDEPREAQRDQTQGAESKLVKNLSTDPEVRIYNERLAVKLTEYAQMLRGRLHSPVDPVQVIFDWPYTANKIGCCCRSTHLTPFW
jgi:hypothetical protein